MEDEHVAVRCSLRAPPCTIWLLWAYLSLIWFKYVARRIWLCCRSSFGIRVAVVCQGRILSPIIVHSVRLCFDMDPGRCGLT